MNCVVIPPVLKNNPSKLSQGDFCVRKPREVCHNIDFNENVSSGIRCIFWSNFYLPYVFLWNSQNEYNFDVTRKIFHYVTLAVNQLNEFYCCSTGKINPAVFYWQKLNFFYWSKAYWYSIFKSQVLAVKQILQFLWLDLVFITIFLGVKVIMSSRPFVFL